MKVANEILEVMNIIIANPNTSAHVLETIVQQCSPHNSSLLKNVIKHPNISEEVLWGLCEHGYKQAVSSSPKATAKVLHSLSQTDNSTIKNNVAKHPNTQPETIKLLTNEHSLYIRLTILDRKDVSEEIVLQLCRSIERKVSDAAIRKLKTFPTFKDWPNEWIAVYLGQTKIKFH